MILFCSVSEARVTSRITRRGERIVLLLYCQTLQSSPRLGFNSINTESTDCSGVVFYTPSYGTCDGKLKQRVIREWITSNMRLK